jgi:hypothetical protein
VPDGSILQKTSRRESVVCQHMLSKLETPTKQHPLQKSAALALGCKMFVTLKINDNLEISVQGNLLL